MHRKSAVPLAPSSNDPSPSQTARLRYGRRLLPALLAGLLMIHALPASGTDIKPPAVAVNYLFPPSPIIQYGTPRLVYELLLLNYASATYTLNSIEVKAGTRTSTGSPAPCEFL